MKYGGTLLIVDDMEKSKYFYETILEQKVLMDLGEHVSLEMASACKQTTKQ